MTIVRVHIPGGGLHRWPDVEKAMVTILDNMLSKLEPAGYACVVPPENMDELIRDGVAIVTVQRAGGSPNNTIDDCRVHVSVTTSMRSDSWEVMGWLRPQLHAFKGTVDNPDGTYAIIQNISDLQGPQKVAAMGTDYRTVNAMFVVQTRLER